MNKKLFEISTREFNYVLPDESVAKYPKEIRDQSKILKWENTRISDHVFSDLPTLLPEGSMLIFNNTRVIHARLFFTKSTGALIEIFCLEPSNPPEYILSFSQRKSCTWKCIVGNLKKWKGEVLIQEILIENESVLLCAEKIRSAEDGHEILFTWNNSKFTFSELLEAAGKIPIPPYLHRPSEQIDLTVYQTVYSKIDGSVAAPTAGLHFTKNVFKALSEKNITCSELTLHVGAGTFQPVKSETIGGHKMHTEHFSVSKSLIDKLINFPGKIIAVGTTSVRTIESLYHIGCKIYRNGIANEDDLKVSQWDPYQNENENIDKITALTALSDYLASKGKDSLETSTQILILPGYQFKMIHGLLTNFHQPQSTLLLLIAAILGEEWKTIYQYALSNGYRFLSYGDSNLYWI